MDLLLVIIILALISTIFSLALGLMVMSGGGPVDKEFSNPLMRARIGFQGLTIVLLIIAVFLR